MIVSGLSAGGTIAAWVGQYRMDVHRVVLVAPALEVTHVPSLLNGAVLRIALRVPNVSRASPRDSTEPDREPGWATHAVAQTLKLGVAVRRAAAEKPPAVKEISMLLNALRPDDRERRGDRSSASVGGTWRDRRISTCSRTRSICLMTSSIRDIPAATSEAVYPVLEAHDRGHGSGNASGGDTK